MVSSGIYFDSSCNESRPFLVDPQYNYPCDTPQKICAVYALSGINKSVTDGVPSLYIGSAVNHQKRNWEHSRELLSKVHDNAHLQNFYNKYGFQVLKIFVLEHATPETVRDREQQWIDAYKANYGEKILFNISSKVENPFIGLVPWNKGKRGVYKTSEETKKKLSLAGKDRTLSKEHKRRIADSHKGMICSQETKHKLSLARKGKVPWNKGRRSK